MRIVFMGTPEFAVPSLDLLIENHYTIAGVVTVPDKPAGRGLRLVSSPVKEAALAKQIPVLQPEKMKEPAFIDQLQRLNPDLFVVVAFRILPREVFTIPRLGSFNLHASLLPKYRGAAPINWAIIRGEKVTGVTTFFLKETVDTGSVILQARIPIGPDETAGEVHEKLALVGAEIVLHSVRLIEQGKVSPQPQQDNEATPAPKIFKDDCRIDWSKPAVDIHNFIRGLSPRPGAFTSLDGSIVKLYRSQRTGNGSHGKPGEILVAGRRLVVQAGEGAVEILELQQEGKKKLSAEEFLRGAHLKEGSLFR